MPCRIIERPGDWLKKRAAQERERIAREAEQRRQEDARRQEKQRREREEAQTRLRVEAIEQQLEAVRLGYRQAVAHRVRQEMLDAFHAYLHPPQPAEPEVIVIEAEPDPIVRVHRWWG
jgi:hypothetical protein